MKWRDSFVAWMLTLGGGLLVGMLLGLMFKPDSSGNSIGKRTAHWDDPFDSGWGTGDIAVSSSYRQDLEALFPGRLILRRATLVDLRQVEDKEAVTELFLDAPRLAAADYQQLRQYPALRHLRVRAGRVDDEVLNQIAQLSGLQQLNLPQAEFTDEGIGSLTSLSQLQMFRFGSPHVTDEGLRAVASMPRLRFLHVIDTPITDRGLEYLQAARGLESFYVDGSDITDQGIEDFWRPCRTSIFTSTSFTMTVILAGTIMETDGSRHHGTNNCPERLASRRCRRYIGAVAKFSRARRTSLAVVI
jgi:hypothetical protein